MPFMRWWLWPILLFLSSSTESLVPSPSLHTIFSGEAKASSREISPTGRPSPRRWYLKSTTKAHPKNEEDQREAEETEPLSLMAFLRSMNETSYDVSDNSIRTFNMDLYNLAMDDPFAAEDMVQYLHELSNGKLSPDSSSFGIVMEGFIQNNELEAAEEFLFSSDERRNFVPSINECMRLMNAYRDATDRTDGAERAESIMRRYKGEDDKDKLKCVVVEAWCQRANHGDLGLQRAEVLLQEMEQEQACDTSRLYAYTSYMVGLSRRKKKAAIAQDIFDNKIIKPDIVAVTALLNCWAKTRDYAERAMAGDRAFAILDNLEAHDYLKANVFTYRTAIAAIGNSLEPSRSEEIILDRMPRNEIEVDTTTYNALLVNGIRDAKRAIEILESMPVEPDVQTWGAVLRLCDAFRAQSLLDKMERLYKEGKSKVMNAWKRSKAPDALEKIESLLKKMEDIFAKTQTLDVRPNSLSYATYIDALTRYAGSNAGERAEATVDRMVKLYATDLGYIRPTRQIFNALINVWARSEDPDAPRRAEKVFHWMEDQFRNGQDPSVRPDEVSLCGVLNAWASHAKDGGAERAAAVLKHAANVPESERGFPITLAMHNTVIKAIARSGDARSAQRAEAVLLTLEQEYMSGRNNLKPDVVTYSSVINACAYCARGILGTPERADAMKIALRAYNKLTTDQKEQANHIVYGTLFKAIHSLMPISESRDKLVRKLFNRCCETGYVDGFVLAQMRSSCSSLYAELESNYGQLGMNHLLLERLPNKWKTNTI